MYTLLTNKLLLFAEYFKYIKTSLPTCNRQTLATQSTCYLKKRYLSNRYIVSSPAIKLRAKWLAINTNNSDDSPRFYIQNGFVNNSWSLLTTQGRALRQWRRNIVAVHKERQIPRRTASPFVDTSAWSTLRLERNASVTSSRTITLLAGFSALWARDSRGWSFEIRSSSLHCLIGPQDVNNSYDFVIIGGGTSGLAVVDWLTEGGKCERRSKLF
jgi:hypothetical protein